MTQTGRQIRRRFGNKFLLAVVVIAVLGILAGIVGFVW